MSQDQATALMSRMLWQCVIIVGPVLLAILIVGLVISVIQATTQLQEMTLSYVPKMLTAVALLIFLGPWMIGRVVGFARSVIGLIPHLV